MVQAFSHAFREILRREITPPLLHGAIFRNVKKAVSSLFTLLLFVWVL